MKISQVTMKPFPPVAAIVEGETTTLLPEPVAAYITKARLAGRSLAEVLAAARTPDSVTYPTANLFAERPWALHATIPVHPPEVWAFGVTYKKSATFRDEDTGKGKGGLYGSAFSSERPVIFFKGTASRCVGTGEPISVRSDSKFTAPEPELAFVLDAAGTIVGYTVVDDVSAWDIERINFAYQQQSKIFDGNCALGPVIVTPDEIGDPYNLRVACRIHRGGQVAFEDSASTSQLNRTFEDMVRYLTLHNSIPDGTVVCTGTGIIVTEKDALRQDDVVDIEIEKIGTLSNPVKQL